jgi:hypothetical protein
MFAARGVDLDGGDAYEPDLVTYALIDETHKDGIWRVRRGTRFRRTSRRPREYRAGTFR